MADAAARRVSDRGVATPATGPTRLDLPQPARYTPTDQEHQDLSQPARTAATVSTGPVRCARSYPLRPDAAGAGFCLPAATGSTALHNLPVAPADSRCTNAPGSSRSVKPNQLALIGLTGFSPVPFNPGLPPTDQSVQSATAGPARYVHPCTLRPLHPLQPFQRLHPFHPASTERTGSPPATQLLAVLTRTFRKRTRKFWCENLVYKINYFIFATENQSEAPEPSKQTTPKNRENGRYQPHGIPPRRRIRPHR